MKREFLNTITGICVIIAMVFLVYYSINMGSVNIFGATS